MKTIRLTVDLTYDERVRKGNLNMSKYLSKPTHADFLEWCKNHEEDFKEFFEEHILDLIVELEHHDYFGTEGFDKRFS